MKYSGAINKHNLTRKLFVSIIFTFFNSLKISFNLNILKNRGLQNPLFFCQKNYKFQHCLIEGD
jgi:surface polysaccharide O-acyltransferase-like enzyme